MVTSSRCGSSFPRQFWERMQNLYITYSAKNSCLEPQQLPLCAFDSRLSNLRCNVRQHNRKIA